MTRGTMRATLLNLVNLKRKKKKRKGKKEKKNGVKERRGERKEKGALPSLYDLRRLGSRFPANQELKSEYAARATSGYQKLQVSPRFRTGGS